MFTIRSSEGTLPFAELDGKEYPDSGSSLEVALTNRDIYINSRYSPGFIIRDFTKLFHKEAMTAHLSEAEKGELRAVNALSEESMLK